MFIISPVFWYLQTDALFEVHAGATTGGESQQDFITGATSSQSTPQHTRIYCPPEATYLPSSLVLAPAVNALYDVYVVPTFEKELKFSCPNIVPFAAPEDGFGGAARNGHRPFGHPVRRGGWICC